MEPAWEGQLRELRRVVPIAQTQSVAGVILTLCSLDDYAKGFAVRLRIHLETWHPIADASRVREAAFVQQRDDALRRGRADNFEQDQVRQFLHGDDTSIPYPELEILAFGDQGQQFPQGYDGGSRWGSNLEGWVESRYYPALDPAVRHVRLEVPAVEWQRTRGKRQGETVLIDQGPWTFVVPL